MSTILGLVSAGLGVAILPKTAEHVHSPVAFCRVSDYRSERTIGLAVLKDHYLSPAARNFKELHLEWTVLDTEQLYLVLPADHPLADRKEVAIRSIAHEDFVCFKPGYGLRYVFDQMCRGLSISPKLAFPNAGEISVSFLHTLGSRLMPQLIAEFKKKYPNVAFRLYQAANEHLQHMVETGEADICLSSPPLPNEALEQRISQPALSRSIKKLEEELGVPLFIRKTKSIRLTKYGEQFLIKAKQARLALDEGVQQIRESVNLYVGHGSSSFLE
ncbi:LysR family transcriptional regulator [Bacillus licheniformis]|nr:LysR family transcriptional regulator [Bacillus licheniformis]